MSKEDTELLALLGDKHNRSIEIIIPDDLDPKKVVKWSRATASLLDQEDAKVSILLCAAGRLHFLARTNPEVLKAAKVETIKQFEDEVLKCRNHRATVYKFSTAYKALPGLTPDDAAAIGTTNLVVASKVAEGLSESQRKELIQQAKKPVSEFKVYVEETSGLSEKGATTMASFTLLGTAAEVSELKEWLCDKRFIEAASSNAPMMMVLSAIQSWSAEWPAEQAQAEEDEVVLPAKADEW